MSKEKIILKFNEPFSDEYDMPCLASFSFLPHSEKSLTAIAFYNKWMNELKIETENGAFTRIKSIEELKEIFKEGRSCEYIVSDEDLFKFIYASYDMFDKFSNFVGSFSWLLNKNVREIFNKYGYKSKQFRVAQKLYED